MQKFTEIKFIKFNKNVPVSTPVQTLLSLLINSGVESGAVAMSKITKQCSATWKSLVTDLQGVHLDVCGDSLQEDEGGVDEKRPDRAEDEQHHAQR